MNQVGNTCFKASLVKTCSHMKSLLADPPDDMCSSGSIALLGLTTTTEVCFLICCCNSRYQWQASSIFHLSNMIYKLQSLKV
jgi:hypothetical protein